MGNVYVLLAIGIVGMFIINDTRIKGKTKRIYQSSKESGFVFSPLELSLKDDAFHGSDALNFTEWWYFDAALNNGYSVQMSVRVLSILKRTIFFAFSRLDIYKDGILKSHKRKIYFGKKFNASSDFPLVTLGGKQVIKGHKDKANGKWLYDLLFELNDTSANLRFVSCTKGWKGKNPGGDWWGVVLPRALVSGKIKIKNKEIEVNGIGYHDHNWDVKASAARNNLGWFWGKINSDNYTLTWATIFKTRFLGQPLLVINKKNGGYINIEPENIQFIGKDVRMENGKPIPHSFVLDAHNEDVSLHINMKVLEIHHVRMMLTMNYWRYHMKCKGSITVDSKEEGIDETHIAEFLRFK
jgi:hypothetical protein